MANFSGFIEYLEEIIKIESDHIEWLEAARTHTIVEGTWVDTTEQNIAHSRDTIERLTKLLEHARGANG